jgi:ATP-dependent exoDNAse (exonuclease V) beta subunit
VAILCRTRWQSRLVAKFLKERGFPIISADSLALQFAEVVNLLVATMRVLHQSADTLARAEALLLLDKVVRRLPPTPVRARHIATVANDKESGQPFFDELRSLGFEVDEHKTGNLGLYELTEKLISTFGLLGANEESDYLFRFLDLTLEYSLKYGNNLGNFLAYWDERKGALSINAPGGTDAVTITTVHKAKGLAYGIVIVPFADWALVPRTDTMLWGRLETADKPLPGLPDVAVVRLNKALTYTPLAAQDVEEREKTLLDGLNTLYVAFTRPRYRLYVISKSPAEPKKAAAELPLTTAPEPAALQGPARDVADLLAGYLRHLGRWQPDTTSFILNQGSENQKPETKNQKPDTKFPLVNLASTDWHERLTLRRHATTVFDFDEQEAQGELNRKLHYALRRLLSAADLPRVLRQLTAEGFINQPEKPAMESRLQALLADARLAPYFAEGLAVETERPILIGGHTHRAYKPDRLVFGAGDSRATQSVTMLDFKLPPPQEKDKTRLREYARLFRELGYVEVRGLIYYFGTGEVVEV